MVNGFFYHNIMTLDHRVKFVLLLAYSIAALTENPVVASWLLVSALAVLVLCRVHRSPYAKALPVLAGVFAVFFLLGLWSDPSYEGVFKTSVVIAKWVAIAAICVSFFVVTRPYDIMAGLKWLRLPSAFCLAVGMGFRFLPVIFEEMRRIVMAQRARGLGKEVGLQRLTHLPRNLAALIIPLLVGIMIRLDNLWLAMRVRGVDVMKISEGHGFTFSMQNMLAVGYAVAIVAAGVLL
jgi:energy-coupling factor transport system permease protein